MTSPSRYMPRSLVDGRTLHEKRYGEGFRDYLTTRVRVRTIRQCYWSDDCTDPVAMIVELTVDDVPPPTDGYTRMLAKLTPGQWTQVGMCLGHGTEAVQRSLQVLEDAALWAPNRTNPYVFTHAPKVIE